MELELRVCDESGAHSAAMAAVMADVDKCIYDDEFTDDITDEQE